MIMIKMFNKNKNKQKNKDRTAKVGKLMQIINCGKLS